MYQRIPISGLSELEWLELRKTGIGGSDAGAVAGVSPYSSPMKVYRDKTSKEVELVSSEQLRVGKDLEAYVADRFCEATGKKVRKSNYMYRNEDYPWMIADVDRLVVGEDAILECKTCNAYGASAWADGKVPETYVCQCYHYMAVTGKKTCYIACLIMGKEFVYRKIEWDDELINTLIRIEKEFWQNNVKKGIMPPADGSKSCDEIINMRFGKANKGSVIQLIGMNDKLNRRAQIIDKVDELQKEQSKIEQEIKLIMGENEVAESDGFKVTWANVESTRLDAKRIKAEKPDLYEEYAKPCLSRRFVVQAA